jgi:hypothetical protein
VLSLYRHTGSPEVGSKVNGTPSYTEAVKTSALDVSAKELYEQDFFQWTKRNAELLRSGRVSEADLEHIAEEIEDMGKSERRELKSRLRVLLTHLLKWGWQRDKRSTSWHSTAAAQRAELKLLLDDSPSLLSRLPELIEGTYRDAVSQASIETGLTASTFPDRCPFTPEQILDSSYLPE